MRQAERALLSWPLVFLLTVFVIPGTGGQTHVCDGISGGYDTWKAKAVSSHNVIVVGGGIAGLEATKTLLAAGTKNVLLLEAQDYLGGRVKTYRQGSVLVEDGAEWIHGGYRNPLYGLAESLGGLTQPLPDEAYDWRVRTQDGRPGDEDGYLAAAGVMEKCEIDAILANYQDKGYGDCYLDQFPNVYQNSGAVASEKDAWLHYLHMWVVKDTGTYDWRNQSGRDADHFTDWGLDEWNQWAAGYDTLINYTMKSFAASNITKTSSPVCKIFWNSSSSRKAVVVTSARKAYTADYVLVTASVGHLKERHTKLFSPALPRSYSDNFNKIELGIADKVQIGWDRPWWGSGPLDLNVIFTAKTLPTNETWLYGIMEYLSIHQQTPILQSFLTGDYALRMEALSDQEVKDHLMRFLQAVMKTTIPQPTFFRRSKWYKNIWMRGSYNSFVTVAGDRMGLKSRAPFLVPIANTFGKVIFWAGEHTSNTRYGTVDGAMLSGGNAARAIKADIKSRL